MRISKRGIDLIKHFESLRLTAYYCDAGKPTIGYGSTLGITHEDVKNRKTITESQAEALLTKDLARFEDVVNRNVKVKLTQNQFDALVSFAFNVGGGNFTSSTLLKELNKGNYKEVPNQLLRWDKSKGKVLAGLTRRRKAEAYLWNTNDLKFNF